MPLNTAAIDLIETWRLGFLATVSPDGQPNVSPKGTFVVIDAATVAFAEMRSPQTMANLTTNPAVEINFIDILSRRGIRIRGMAEIIDKSTPEFNALNAHFAPLWPDLLNRFNAIVRIPISSVKPLQSPAYELGTTEAEFRALWKTKIGGMP